MFSRGLRKRKIFFEGHKTVPPTHCVRLYNESNFTFQDIYFMLKLLAFYFAKTLKKRSVKSIFDVDVSLIVCSSTCRYSGSFIIINT